MLGDVWTIFCQFLPHILEQPIQSFFIEFRVQFFIYFAINDYQQIINWIQLLVSILSLV